MKTKDVLNIEVLIGAMEWKVNKIEHELEVYSDYAIAYRDLLIMTERKIEELTSFVSQHKEAK